uniref:Uncharacterized protein n=1 Tax=Parascaris univalens TaxID=6257 RepID=A0A914ZG37_PARUN
PLDGCYLMPCIAELESNTLAENFNANDVRYRCCFQNFHVQI